MAVLARKYNIGLMGKSVASCAVISWFLLLWGALGNGKCAKNAAWGIIKLRNERSEDEGSSYGIMLELVEELDSYFGTS